MAFLMQNQATAIGASRGIKVGKGVTDHTVEVDVLSTTGTAISAVTVNLQGSMTGEDRDTGVLTNPTLADGSTAQRVSSATFYYILNGTSYTKTSVAAGEVFTNVETAAAFTGTITGSTVGGAVVMLNSAGTMYHWFPASTQAYASIAACLLVLRAYVPPKNMCRIGYVVISAAGGGFTFGTTALTGVSAYFNDTSTFIDFASHALDASEITAHRSLFHVSDKTAPYIRTFLSALTGTGYVTVRYTPKERWQG